MPTDRAGGATRSRLRWAAPHWLAVPAGGLAAIGHAPFDLPWVSVAGFALAIWAVAMEARPRRAAVTAWIFATAYFAITLHWIVEPFLVDAARDGWMAPFALVFLSGGLALIWAGAGWLAAWLASRAPRRAIAMAVTLTAAEMLRAVLFGGFPWAMPSAIWAASPMRGMAAWIGPHGLTLLTLLAATLIAIAAVERSRLRCGLAGIAAVVVLPGGMVLGAATIAAIPQTAPESAPRLRIVQPNAAQHLKWRQDMMPVFWQRGLDLTALPGTFDAVIWPETSLPVLLDRRPDMLAAITDAANGAPAVIGARRYDPPALYNTLAVLEPGGAVASVYDKHHLVPFGEFIPGGRWIERLGIAGLATGSLGGYSSGPGPRVLDLTDQGLGRVLPLICYEAIFPRYADAKGERPDWIVQLTNDAWFGRLAGPQQHLAQARMRAVEQGLPLVRSANTGISAVIDAGGRLRGTLPLGSANVLDAALPAPAAPTLYARTGGWPVMAVLVAAGLALAATRRRA